MNDRHTDPVALVMFQLLYGLIFKFANDVIVGGYFKPFGFILLRVVCAGLLFWLFGIFTPSKKIERGDFPKLVSAAFFGVALNMPPFFKGLQYTTPINGAMIMIAVPIIILVLSAIILIEPIKKIKVLGIGLGLSGALILSLCGKSSTNGTNM